MKNFLVATINKEGKMFKIDADNDLTPVAIIPEHISRITELSDNCHIYMDGETFKAFDEKSFPNRFTRVFVNEKDFDKQASSAFRLHHMDELDAIIKRKEFYEKNTRTFFVGTPEFLKLCAQYSDTMLLTVVDLPVSGQTLDMPIELKKSFGSRKEIKPEQLEAINKMRSKIIAQDTIEIAENGAIIKRKANIDKFEGNEMLNIPDYMFYEFRKTADYVYTYKEYSAAKAKSAITETDSPVWRGQLNSVA